MSAEVERLVAGSREEWDDGADDKWLWGEQNHRASARLDHSVTQSCPGSTSLPDGCLLRMCKENRRSRCSVFVSVCVRVVMLSIPCRSTQAVCCCSCCAFLEGRGKSQPPLTPSLFILWPSFEVVGFFFTISCTRAHTNLNGHTVPSLAQIFFFFCCLLPVSQQVHVTEYFRDRGIIGSDVWVDFFFLVPYFCRTNLKPI